MYTSFSSIYAITGQKVKVKCPSNLETTLLFVNRYRFSNNSLVDVFIQSEQANSKKEKLLTFNNDEKDTCSINLTIQPNATVYFSFQGQDCGIRLLLGTKSSQSIQCTVPLIKTLEPKQIEDFSKKILAELEKAFKSDQSLLIMLVLFEKYFSTCFFLQKEEEFPNLIQNIFQTSIKRLVDNPIDNFYKLISFISFKLSLGYELTEAAAIIVISFIKSILTNDSSSSTVNEIINQCYDTPNFLIFQALFINIKPNIINQSLLLPITFYTNKNMDAILSIYNYVVTNKVKIHFTYLNLFTLVASEDELKLLFNQNQLYDPEGTILEKNDNHHYQIIDTQIVASSFFEKKEVQNTSFNFKPKKISQFSPQKLPEQNSPKRYTPTLNLSTPCNMNFPSNEISLSVSRSIPCIIQPTTNSLNIKSIHEELQTQPSKETKQLDKSSQAGKRKGSQMQNTSNQKKQGKTAKQQKQVKQRKTVINNKISKENEETKKVIKSKPARESLKNLLLFFVFSIIVIITIILLLCQYFFI